MPFKDSLILGIIDVYDFCISKEDLNFEKKTKYKMKVLVLINVQSNDPLWFITFKYCR